MSISVSIMKFLITSVLLSQVVFASVSQAQVATLSLMGNVQSEDRRALPGAAVTVIHMPSGVRHAASSDGAGRFTIPNLIVGGPYLIRVGEGGYRPQTVENIFLEAGKTANFTVVLNKLTSDNAKGRNNRTANPASESNGTTMTLAKDAVVGGPVLVTLTPNQPRNGSGTSSARTAPALAAAVAPANSPSGRNPTPASTAAPAAAAAKVPAPSVATAAPRYNRRPYTPGKPYAAKKVSDPIVPGHFDAKSGNYIYHTGTPTTLKLANGTIISGVGINSTESYLHRFLSDPAAQVDTADLTRGWYNFDRVFFMTGKATLAPE